MARNMGNLQVVESPRPDTKAAEDRYFLTAYREALERISLALEMPGSPNLITSVPEEVERRLASATRRDPVSRHDSKPITTFTGAPPPEAPARAQRPRRVITRRVAQTDAVDPPLELEGAADRVTIEVAAGGYSVRATSEGSESTPWRDETAVATSIEGRDKLVTRFLGESESGS